MKTNISKSGISLLLILTGMWTSCSDVTNDVKGDDNKKTALEVSVAGIGDTRTVITGNTLPDNSRFALFFNSSSSVGVNYNNGTCTLESPVLLEEQNSETQVYAIYPYVPSVEVDIDTSVSQDDYLSGIGVDSNGATLYPTIDRPRAFIQFEHILARITVNIRKDASIEGYYKISSVFLGGDDDTAYRVAQYVPYTNKFQYIDNDPSKNIRGTREDDKYLLDTAEDVVTVDFLVIPSETTWQMNLIDISNTWWALPRANYEPGKQYIYDCVIRDGYKLSISKSEIVSWDTTTMPGRDATVN